MQPTASRSLQPCELRWLERSAGYKPNHLRPTPCPTPRPPNVNNQLYLNRLFKYYQFLSCVCVRVRLANNTDLPPHFDWGPLPLNTRFRYSIQIAQKFVKLKFLIKKFSTFIVMYIYIKTEFS